MNAGIKAGDTVLVTGAGGGVALLAAQLCVAHGAHVYVTSSSSAKIASVVAFGVAGGVQYTAKDWPARLAKLLQEHGRGELDSVIDGGGGDILGMLGKPGLLKFGGKVVCYGMCVASVLRTLSRHADEMKRTARPKITMTMRNVMSNQQLIGEIRIPLLSLWLVTNSLGDLLGSTMGSREDLLNATNFIAKHNLVVPTIDQVLNGLEAAEEGFNLMKSSGQTGKIVMRVRHEDDGNVLARL